MNRVGRASLVLALGLLAASPARAEGVRYVDPIFSVTEEADVTYGTATSWQNQPEPLLLDVFLPVGDALAARPAIVFAHGGGFSSGSRKDLDVRIVAIGFAARGYVTASISYRLRAVNPLDLVVGSLGGEMPDAMHDAQLDMQAAVRWLRARATTYRVDPARIAAAGISAGASMALETAYNPDDPGNGRASTNDREASQDVSAAVAVSGATDPRRIELGRPAVAMFNGTHDTTAPYPFAVSACAIATALVNVCELTTYPGSGHDLGSHRDDIVARSADFLCRRVLGGCAAA